MAPTIHAHQLTSVNSNDNAQAITNALRILKPHLPISIPLYRRLQCGRFFESSTLLTSVEDLAEDPRPDDDPWAMAFVDRGCRPETEVWIFGSWEMSGSQSDDQDQDQDDDESELLRSLVKAIRSLSPPPPSIHQEQIDPTVAASNSIKDHSGTSRTDYSAHMLSSNLILFGAVHSSTTRLLEKNGLLKNVFDAGLVPNWTYVFDTDNLPIDLSSDTLPDDLEWGDLRRPDLALVRARTQIPRQERTLAELPSQAIVEKESGRLVAWVFVGLDGSLTSLHVEEEWRGRKLGMMLAAKLWKEKMSRFWNDSSDKEEKLAHDYVIFGNEASKKVSERLGGRYIGDTYWVRVDLGAV